MTLVDLSNERATSLVQTSRIITSIFSFSYIFLYDRTVKNLPLLTTLRQHTERFDPSRSLARISKTNKARSGGSSPADSSNPLYLSAEFRCPRGVRGSGGDRAAIGRERAASRYGGISRSGSPTRGPGLRNASKAKAPAATECGLAPIMRRDPAIAPHGAREYGGA